MASAICCTVRSCESVSTCAAASPGVKAMFVPPVSCPLVLWIKQKALSAKCSALPIMPLMYLVSKSSVRYISAFARISAWFPCDSVQRQNLVVAHSTAHRHSHTAHHGYILLFPCIHMGYICYGYNIRFLTAFVNRKFDTISDMICEDVSPDMTKTSTDAVLNTPYGDTDL